MERIPLKNGKLLTIREAEPQDSAALLDFSKVIGGETDFLSTDASGWPQTAEDEAERLAASLITPGQGLFLDWIDGEIVGLFSVYPLSGRPRTKQNAVFGIAVRKSCWGLGIGSFALTLSVDYAKEWGYHKLCLEANAENTRALALYRRFGFAECGRYREHYLIGGRYVDAVLMEKLL